MAIETLQVVHTDLEVRGGLRYVAITTINDPSGVTYDNDADHAISAVAGVADAKLFDLKQGTGSLSTTGNKENGTIMFENTVSFYVPNMSSAHFHALKSIMHEPLAVFVKDYNDVSYCIGLSEKYNETGDYPSSQMYAKLVSLEGSSGSALTDENGVTVTITAMEGELPRNFSGTFTPAADGSVTIS